MSRAPNFSLINIIENNPSIRCDAVNISQIFESIANHLRLEITYSNLDHILKNELFIKMTNLNSQAKNALREGLIYYITIWHGWKQIKRAINGIWGNVDDFINFRLFLKQKCSKLSKVSLGTTKYKQHKETMTTVIGKGEAPYQLIINSPLYVFNHIIFKETGDDICVLQVPVKHMGSFSINQMLNWPYMYVKVDLLNISFTRANDHHYERYLTSDDSFTHKPEKNLEITKAPEANDTNVIVYTHRIISAYFKQLLSLDEQLFNKKSRLSSELKVIFDEFLQDIMEANYMNGVAATNLKISYNIGSKQYRRIRKQLIPRDVEASENTSKTNFIEMISPRIEYTLHHFKASQVLTDTQKISFRCLNELSEKKDIPFELQQHIYNCITYGCTLCNVKYSGIMALVDVHTHLMQKHKNELPVTCCNCKLVCSVSTLAEKRWTHNCELQTMY